ncbi:MAG: FAD-dependent oxidoreductase [Armatimonadetes bacterium]|nr:FAD-dependent oxidoreductase [Armatimonadota bacterium]
MDTVTRTIDRTHSCELLVVGSGVAGMTAALQAARLGVDTILIEKESVLGGNSGPLLGIHWGGAHIYHDYAAETGIVMELEEEIAWRGGKHHTPDHHYNISRLAEGIWQETLEQAGVRVLKRHLARETEVAVSPSAGPGAQDAPPADSTSRNVTAVIADDLALGQTVRFEISHALLDASGDGQAAFAAGASFRMGRESREEFGERSAPEVADNRVAGVSMTALVRRSEGAIPFLPPSSAFEVALNTKAGGWLGERDNIRMIWPTETGGTLLDPIKDEHEIYERLLRQLYHVFADLKQDPKNADWELIWISPIAGKRETRRFIGDHMITQTELEGPATLPDRLGYGGFTIDQHEQGEDGVNRIFMYSSPPLYDTCYRMTYSRDFDNLYLAGRLISSTHMAHGSTRIIKTGGLLAQGTGIAVALAKRHGCTAREVAEQHLPELQQEFLRQDGSIIDLPADDPRDRARTAAVTASSEWTYGDFSHGSRSVTARTPQMVGLEGAMGSVLYAWPEQLAAVRAFVSNATGVAQPLRLTVAHATDAPPRLKPRPSDEEAGFFHHLFEADKQVSMLRTLGEATVDVPAGHEGWVDIALAEALVLPPRSREHRHQGVALLLAGEGFSVGLDPAYCDVAQVVRAGTEAPELSEGRLLIVPDDHVPLGEAANVINGVSRRWGRAPLNLWVSRPGEPLPQWLELRWSEPRTISRLALTFDGIGRRYTDMPFNNGTRAFGPMVRDYRVEVEVGEGWRELVSVTDNIHRFRVHEFDRVPATAVRLVVEAAHEEGEGARVAEVRVE